MDVLIAYANKKGWVTAQAGRPDVHRAGNASTYTFYIFISPHTLWLRLLFPIVRCAHTDLRLVFYTLPPPSCVF